MSSPAPGPSAGLAPITRYIVLAVAAIGFLFDTYELLMFPVIGADALAELLKKPPASDEVRLWTGRMLWIAALCGGAFGLLGGWLIDRLGRKTVMVASIFLYSFSPVAAAFSTELWQLVLFRCTTFIGVSVEMVAAVTWLAELFDDKRTRELVIGWTLAFASLGGILVTEVYNLIVAAAQTPGNLPHIPFPEGHDPANVAWRYTLLTGLIPGALILLLMPFVPESRVWSERKRAGTLRRPRFAELFAPELRRTTIVTALLSACAYAAAFGALQLTPPVISTGLPDLAGRQAELGKREAGLKTDRENLAKNKAELAKQTGEGAAAGKARIAQSEAEIAKKEAEL
ncbi:MAG TPA: MFS transporter, partial [Gemmataceae bacterium]|nr:MFS transporter [Gemmataceae bacterium]